MSLVERAREEVLQGVDLTRAVRRATPHHAPPWQALARVLAELHGAGASIQPLLDDPRVTDVLVNGDDNVWVDGGAGLRRLDLHVDARELAQRLATLAGRRLDNAVPIVDGRLPDGTRLHAVLPPVVHGSAHISLRRAAKTALTWEQLVASEFLNDHQAQVVTSLVQVRANVLISGAGGAGKTTLAAAALGQVPPGERIVIIEEAMELQPAHPHVVHLQGRRANVQGVGEVGLSDLVRAAMRMRADRLVLGECRGEEVRDLLAGFNTGHDGGWATIHANTAQDVPARLTALGALARMSPRTVELQARAGLDAIIHVRRSGEHRFVEQIGVVAKEEPLLVLPALSRDLTRPQRSLPGPGWPTLAAILDQDLT